MAVKISGIYLIRNIINNNTYIGQSSSIIRRWQSHKQRLTKGNHSNIHLQRAWNLYSEEAFEFSILSTCEPQVESLCEAEQYWMDLLTPDYNISPTAGSTLGFKMSDQHKLKISLATKGKLKSQHMKDALKSA